MNVADANANTALRVYVSRFIAAPRERLFEAWLNPEIRRRWWVTARGEGPTACDIDARVGGRYCIKQIGSGAESADRDDDYEWIMEGEFVEIVEPEKIAFTWTVNHPNEPPSDELVTVEFRKVKGGTEVTITHTGILSSRLRDGTEEGWTKALEILAGVMQGQ